MDRSITSRRILPAVSHATRRNDELTIDELARTTGMTVRNIRAHQSRGLLPPPAVRGRIGYYGPEHVARIQLIKELQADGFNLEAIRRLLQSAGGSTAEVLRFTRAVAESFEVERPRMTDIESLREQWGPDRSPRLLDRAVELGLLRPVGDGRYEERSPRLATAARELARLGVSPERTLDVAEEIRRGADRIAGAFVQLFLDEVWRPFVDAGQPADRWPEVFDALERLRPLAAESLLGVFQIAMTERVERELGDQIERLADETRGAA
jgi:DNA-binding transcriptional MerR regulator